MKKTLFLSSVCCAFCGGVAHAEDAQPVKETITLTSDTVTSETFTETAPGNGMFYSDKNNVAFLAGGTAENPYYITTADDTHANASDISLSAGAGHTVTVGGFTGDAYLAIGTEDTPVRVYTENSLFIGGYGWHGTSGWRTNAKLNSNTRGEIPFESHEGTVVINKGSVLDTGTGGTALGGAQIYIGHGGKGTMIVDGGTVTTRAFLGLATATATPDDNSGLLEIKNGGNVHITAEPDKINSYYNQLMIGGSNTGTGNIIVSGEGSQFVMDSSALEPAASTGQSTHYSFVSIGTGNGGQGTITVTDKAALTLGTENAGLTLIYLGEGAGATGALNVKENSSAALNGYTYIGAQGKGALNVESGASVEQTSGVMLVGMSGGEGELNVKGTGSSLSSGAMEIGYDGAKGSVNVGTGADLTVNGNLIASDTKDDGISNSLTNDGEMKVSGYIYLTSGTTTTNNGTMTADGAVYIADGATFENAEGATLESTTSFISLYAGSHTTNKGEMKATDIYIAAGAELTNTGSMTVAGGADGISLADGATINNEGSLNGQISGKGTVQGTGTLGAVSIGQDTTYMVGGVDAPIFGVEASTFTLEEASLTVFNVDGATAAQSGQEATWGSGLHSAIYGNVVSLEAGAGIEIVFSSTMEGLEHGIEFNLKLIDGGEGSSYDLETLLSNTTFTLAEQISTFSLTSAELELLVSDATYTVVDNDLYLSGTAKISPIPEPTTATLSLLALCALASRRRRK